VSDETPPEGGHAQVTELKDSHPHDAEPERAAGGMGIEPKADYPSKDPRSD